MTLQKYNITTSLDELDCLVPHTLIDLKKFLYIGFNFAQSIKHLLTDTQSKKALKTLEKYLDGKVTKNILDNTKRQITELWTERREASLWLPNPDHFLLSAVMACLCNNPITTSYWVSQCLRNTTFSQQSLNQLHCDIFRDIIPYQTPSLNPHILRWNNKTIPTYAQILYNNNYQNIALLGDMLEDAGCTNPTLLDHCRTPQTHYKGCWVVDLLLG